MPKKPQITKAPRLDNRPVKRSLSELNLMNGDALIAAMARIRATVLSRGIMNSFATLRSILGTAQRNKKMEAIDIYRQAIKRTFANLYDESPDEVDVTWGNAYDTMTVHCSHKTFAHEILSNDNDTTLEFVSDNEDPITV